MEGKFWSIENKKTKKSSHERVRKRGVKFKTKEYKKPDEEDKNGDRNLTIGKDLSGKNQGRKDGTTAFFFGRRSQSLRGFKFFLPKIYF